MTALVTGASSDIGAAIAGDLAALGHGLVLWGRDAGRLARAAAVPTARTEAFDLRDRGRLRDAAARVDRVDVVVCAAAAFDFGPAEEADPDVVEAVLDTTLTATALTCRLLLPALLATASSGSPSSLVLVGSGADRTAFAGNAAYVAAKHGVRGLADALAIELRDRHVRVTLVSPGLVAAGSGLDAPDARDAPERLLRPEDVAAAVRFAVTFPGPGSVLHLDLEPGAA